MYLNTLSRAQIELTWLADVIVGLAYTGLRISELASLRWQSILFSQTMFTIVDESRRTGGGRTVRSTKSSKSRSIRHNALRCAEFNNTLPLVSTLPHARTRRYCHQSKNGHFLGRLTCKPTKRLNGYSKGDCSVITTLR